jgi:hypothetical protein
MLKGGSTYVREGEAETLKSAKPFPPKARRLAIIFSVILMALAALPVIIEAAGEPVRIGPWLGLLITLPVTLFAMVMMVFLRDGMAGNLVSGTAVLFAMTMGYSLEFDPGNEQRALFIRAACPVVTAAILGFFWLNLKVNLRDIHFMIAEGQSMQDIMLRYQQASIIRKKGGKPALMPDGTVVDANEVVGKPGFRTPPKEQQAAAQTKKKKRKKPRLR